MCSFLHPTASLSGSLWFTIQSSVQWFLLPGTLLIPDLTLRQQRVRTQRAGLINRLPGTTLPNTRESEKSSRANTISKAFPKPLVPQTQFFGFPFLHCSDESWHRAANCLRFHLSYIASHWTTRLTAFFVAPVSHTSINTRWTYSLPSIQRRCVLQTFLLNSFICLPDHSFHQSSFTCNSDSQR